MGDVIVFYSRSTEIVGLIPLNYYEREWFTYARAPVL